MQANDTIDLSGIRTLVLQGQTIATILDALADKPYRISNGPINEIFNQLRPAPQESGSTTDGAGNANGVSGEGNVKADSNDGGNRKPAG